MNLSEIEIRTLNGMGDNGEARGDGWAPVPEGCPPHIAKKIAERRAKTLGYTPAPVETRDAKAALAELGL